MANPENTAPGANDETFDLLRNRIRDQFESLSPHLRRIARAALDKPNFIALNTIAVIAEEVQVQPSTLIRFSKEFGYSGFSELQRIFRHRLIEGAPVFREQVYQEQHSGDHPVDLTATLNGCVDAQIASLERIRHDINVRDLSAAVDMLQNAGHIYVAGLRRSRPIATYLAYGLNRLERQCSLLDFGGGMAEQQIANLQPRDVFFAIAFTPYTPAVVDIVRDANYRGHSIITMTDTASSPLAQNATISFFTDKETAGRFRPISGGICLVQAIIESLGERSFPA